MNFLAIVLSVFTIVNFFILLESANVTQKNPSDLKYNDGNNQSKTNQNITDEKLDIGALLPLLQQLINQTAGIFSTASPSTTTTKPSTTTASPTTVSPSTCRCGTGAKPKVSRKDLDESEENESEEENRDFFEILKSISETDSEDKSGAFSNHNNSSQDRIIHGIASNPNGWPWMVGLILGFNINGTNPTNFNLFCGGSLINSQFVVTASHCFNDFTSTAQIISQVSVLLGTNSLASRVKNRVVSTISAVTIHPQFNRTTFDNDITLLKLSVPVNFTKTINPICLSQAGTPFANRQVITSGWGSTSSNGSTPVPFLREAGLKTLTNSACNGTSSGPVTANMICATGSKPATNSNTCRGDSGGPLMLAKGNGTFTLIGLTSHGPNVCGQTGIPVVYTRINSYIPFIKQVTNGTSFCSNSF